MNHIRQVGPGMLSVSCDGKSYQCVVSLVRGQAGFNCAETQAAQPPPATGGGEISM